MRRCVNMSICVFLWFTRIDSKKSLDREWRDKVGPQMKEDHQRFTEFGGNEYYFHLWLKILADLVTKWEKMGTDMNSYIVAEGRGNNALLLKG